MHQLLVDMIAMRARAPEGWLADQCVEIGLRERVANDEAAASLSPAQAAELIVTFLEFA